ncbi:hypothetical protein Tco_1263560 [Tanacetum coccineum]
MFRIASTPIQTRTPQLPHASRNTNPLCLNLQELFTRLSLADHSLSAIKVKVNGSWLNNRHASKPKRKVKKSVATPHKKTVASVTTIQKSKSYYKKLYENTNPEWRWWIAKRCPSAYTWTQKPLRTKKIWMPKVRKDDESTSISPTIDIVSRITMPRSSMFTRRLIAADQASVFMEMMSVHISSGLVLYQMTFDHNRSELGIQDHNNEPSSLKSGVPKVVPLAVKDSSNHGQSGITIPPSHSNAEDNSHKVVRLGINPMIQPEPEDLPKDNPKLEIAVLRSNGGNDNLNPIQMLNLQRHTI